jgi:hypothetical protein
VIGRAIFTFREGKQTRAQRALTIEPILAGNARLVTIAQTAAAKVDRNGGPVMAAIRTILIAGLRGAAALALSLSTAAPIGAGDLVHEPPAAATCYLCGPAHTGTPAWTD